MFIKDYENSLQLMKSAIENFNPKKKDHYAQFLAQTYFYVSHSTKLLAFAAGLMNKEDETLFRRFIKHISEESSHEVLAEKDLNDLSFSLTAFKELPATKMLWETQYYKIQHEDPASFLGYILILEAFACHCFPNFLEKIDQAYEGKAHRFVKLHAEEDPDHIEKAFDVIDRLSEERKELVRINMNQTAKAYTMMLESISMSH